MRNLMDTYLWEVDFRDRLNKEIPEGTYLINKDGIPVFVSKPGRINYEVQVERKIRRLMLLN